DDEDEEVTQPKIQKNTIKPSIAKIEFVKTKQLEKKARKTIKQVENPRQNTHKPIGNQRNWNNVMSQRLETILVNTARQVSTAHLKSTVNAARPKSYPSKSSHSSVKRLIHKKTSFKNSNVNKRVNTVRAKTVNTARPKAVANVVQGNIVNVVKASGTCPILLSMKKLMEDMLPLEVTLKEGKSQENVL
nr:hypothetical protein [Tanacetum cinerariifolium]